MKVNIVQNKNYYIKVISAGLFILSLLELFYFLNHYSIHYPYFPDCYGSDYFLKNKPLLTAISLSILFFSFTLISKPYITRALIIFESFIFIFKIIFLKSYHFSCMLSFGFTDWHSYYMDLVGLTLRTILISIIFLNKKITISLILIYIIGYLFIRERLTFWLGCSFGLC